jgi:toxin ParE1/3/4
MSLPVRLLDDALADLDDIQTWGAEEFGPAHAIAFGESLLDRLALLSAHPRIGRVGRVDGTREWPLLGTPFIVVYREPGQSVDVLRILHGARQWPHT